MEQYAAYIFDLDGTVYRGTEPIHAAIYLINELQARGIPCGFVTNNSTKTPEAVAEKLNGFGLDVRPSQIMTSSLASAAYVQEHGIQRVHLIGEEGLKEALTAKGLEITGTQPEAVICGMDRGITYEKIQQAARAVDEGSLFVATNTDRALPAEDGLKPGNGALVSTVAVASNQKPVVIGKPEPSIMHAALNAFAFEADATLMVGDNYDTDILAGMRAGLDTLLVYSGVSTRDEVSLKPEQPTYELSDLSHWQLKS
ncbi:4-nitrophenyl phosphatase [Salsuginibacillus halophilus]|uniref:4-nitrophenyl phosphatase n=1 Tax=Salsuginibacillus halophilus TaxID=517424 RepID=A0A2P8HE12_9BACI|nr:TIGR01457 family HAD-type hydrolase [Salsuginibacillus halophilus]PSL44450.1 4-nitrophenyl phosphatase [Salsuginibacillus halophilus]